MCTISKSEVMLKFVRAESSKFLRNDGSVARGILKKNFVTIIVVGFPSIVALSVEPTTTHLHICEILTTATSHHEIFESLRKVRGKKDILAANSSNGHDLLFMALYIQTSYLNKKHRNKASFC